MVARYVQIADELRARIDGGEYAEQSSLPKQADLARDFDVNVNTVAAALKLLEREGRVQSRRSRGTVVLPRIPLQKVGSATYHPSKWTSPRPRTGSGEAGPSSASDSSELTTVGVAPADEEMAERLNVVPGDDLVCRTSVVRDADGTVSQIVRKYYAYAVAKGTLLMSEESGPANRWREFQILTDVGLEPATVDERLHARLPDAGELRALGVSVGEPVVETRRRVYAASSTPVEYSTGLYRASRFQWNYTFDLSVRDDQE